MNFVEGRFLALLAVLFCCVSLSPVRACDCGATAVHPQQHLCYSDSFGEDVFNRTMASCPATLQFSQGFTLCIAAIKGVFLRKEDTGSRTTAYDVRVQQDFKVFAFFVLHTCGLQKFPCLPCIQLIDIFVSKVHVLACNVCNF